MKNKSILISSCCVNLDNDVTTIENEILAALNIYFKGLQVRYSEDSKTNSVSIVIERPAKQMMTGSWITDIDCSMLTGLDPEMFQVDPTGLTQKKYKQNFGLEIPLVYPTIPFQNNFYVADNEFEKLYKGMIESKCGCKVKRLKVLPTNKELAVVITFTKK